MLSKFKRINFYSPEIIRKPQDDLILEARFEDNPLETH